MRHTIAAFASAACLLLGFSTAASGYDLRPLKGPRADVAALLLTGGESGTLRASGLATSPCIMTGEEAAGSNDTVAALLNVEVEGQSLLDAVAAGDESTVPDSVRIELYVYVMTRSGEIVDSRSLWTRLPLGEIAGRPGSGVRLVEKLRLPPGEYQLRTLVREPRSQQFALRVLGLTVSAPGAPALSISPPMFSDDAEEWLVATGSAGSPESVSTLPVLVVGVPKSFALQGCHLERLRFEAQLLTRERQPVAGATIRIGPAMDDGPGQTVEAEISVSQAEPGLHLLDVTASADDSSSKQTLPVFVTDSPAVSTWTALGSRSEPSQLPADSLDLEQTKSSSKRIRALEVAYLGTLELLAAGRLEDATASLAMLEKRAAESHENARKAIKWLTEAENRVTARLIRKDPECLLPVLQLHLELQRRYAATGEVGSELLHATRNRVRSLAQVYATDARQEMAPTLSASVLAELATQFAQSGYLTSALIVLREALALDAQNTDVILDLAYQYEHHRFWNEALELLERLLELEPRSDEGRLRMAMVLLRLDRDAEGYSLLRKIVSDARSEWVLAIAYQELGHHLLQQQEFDEAVGLLEQAVRRLPTTGRLRIELSHALDRAGRRHEAREAVAELATTRDPSPRLNYRVPDRSGNRLSRTDLLRHSTARFPLLAAALADVERPQ